MLNITGLNRFFLVHDFHGMSCKYDKVLSVFFFFLFFVLSVKLQQLNRELEDGDVFIVMSKDLRLVRLFCYDQRSYSMFENVSGRGTSLSYHEYRSYDLSWQ